MFMGSSKSRFLCHVSEKGTRHMTRGLKSQVLQQQMIDVDKALEILDQKIPPLVVDRDKLKVKYCCHASPARNITHSDKSASAVLWSVGIEAAFLCFRSCY